MNIEWYVDDFDYSRLHYVIPPVSQYNAVFLYKCVTAQHIYVKHTAL